MSGPSTQFETEIDAALYREEHADDYDIEANRGDELRDDPETWDLAPQARMLDHFLSRVMR